MDQRVYMEDRSKQLDVSSDEKNYISLLQQQQPANHLRSDNLHEDENGEEESSCNVSPASSNKSFRDYSTSAANFDRSTPRLFHPMLSNNLSRRNSTSKMNNLVQDFSCMAVMDSPSEEYVRWHDVLPHVRKNKKMANSTFGDTGPRRLTQPALYL
jgi:hypothetical protein